MFFAALKTTLKLQPVVICFSLVSILSKLASQQLPESGQNLLEGLANYKLLLLIFLMFTILAVYALVWQIIIKNAKIAIIYANKSSYLFWTQIAAITVFGEHLSWCNIFGIILIFFGILLGNSEI